MKSSASRRLARIGAAPAYGGILGSEPLLTAAEEVELANAARAGDADARDRLVRANLRLVLAIARGFRGRGLDLDDLVGEGNLGLIRAVSEFDPRFGARFATYAAYWIRQAIRHALITTTAPIRLPAYMVRLLTRWRRAERAALRATGVTPSLEELAASLGLSQARRRMVEQALRATQAVLAGDRGDGGGLAEAVDEGEAPEAPVEAEDTRRELRRRLDRLEGRERVIVEQHYGLGGGEPQTLKEIGHRMGVTREWVRKLEARALRNLAHDRSDAGLFRPSRDRPLGPTPGSRPRGGRRDAGVPRPDPPACESPRSAAGPVAAPCGRVPDSQGGVSPGGPWR